jgi:hypothetical protein
MDALRTDSCQLEIRQRLVRQRRNQMSQLRISSFGRFCAQCDDQLAEGFETQKVQELFCYLHLHRDRPHPREKLADMLWSSGSSAQAKVIRAGMIVSDGRVKTSYATPKMLPALRASHTLLAQSWPGPGPTLFPAHHPHSRLDGAGRGYCDHPRGAMQSQRRPRRRPTQRKLLAPVI